MATGDSGDLKLMRERFTHASSVWEDVKREGAKDMRYVAGDPWDPEDRSKREDAKRPCLLLRTWSKP